MVSRRSLLTLYQEKLRFLHRILASEGYDTYIHTSWSRFEIVSAGVLQIGKPELMKDFGSRFVFSMAVFEDSRTFIAHPPHYNYFDDIILPQQEDPDLTPDEVLDNVLSNVSVVLFDNEDHDPFIQTVLEKALHLGKRMININFPIPG